MAACLLACGVDPERTVLFQQSHVPYHADLAWIIGATVTVAQLQRHSQYKDKSVSYQKHGNIPLGLLTYPVLQAADILLYSATHVPVGDDQRQHLEMACDIARNVNHKIGDNVLTVPQAMYTEHARIRSLRDPESKMSKSDRDQRSRIELSDTPEQIRKKCQRAVSDSTATIFYDPTNRRAISNLLELHSAVTDKSINNICAEVSNLDTLGYKRQLAQDIIDRFEPMRQKYETFVSDHQLIKDILWSGAEKATVVARENILRIKTACGFL